MNEEVVEKLVTKIQDLERRLSRAESRETVNVIVKGTTGNPVTGVQGNILINTADSKIFMWMGGAWVEITGGGTGTGVTDHGALTGLLDDDHTQYVKHVLSTAANDFLVGSGSNTYVKKTLAEVLTIIGKAGVSGLASLDASSLVVQNPANATATPTASKIPIADANGKLNAWINTFEIATPGADVSAQGIIRTMTVDTNAEGIGAPLFMALDGHLDTADADAVASMPCIGLALETGTGSKKVLLYGTIRVDAWTWTIGPGAAGQIYVSGTVGTLTQTLPATVDDVIQPVGYAISADEMMFTPSMMWITHTG